MGTDLSYRPEEDEDEQQSGFDEDSPQSVYDDEFDKVIDANDLKDKEENPDGADNDDDDTDAGDDEKDELETKGLYSGGSKSGKGRNKKIAIAAGGSSIFALFGIVAMIFVFMGMLKNVHMGEVLSTAGYARFNGILQERATQNIFDASIVQGEGSVSLRGRTLVDRIKFRNVDLQIAKMGRTNDLSFIYKEGKMNGVNIKGEVITLDSITKEMGFGDSYASISEGFFRKKLGWRKTLSVKAEFSRRIKASFGEAFAQEPRFVRSRTFGTIADNVGFKFSGWRNKARDFLGKKPLDAIVEDTNNSVDSVMQDGENTGVEAIDKPAEEMRNQKTFEKIIKEKGGVFDKAELQNALAQNVEKGTKIQELSTKVGAGVLVASLACMANQAFTRIDQVEEKNEIAASNMALEPLAKRDQTKTGETTYEASGATAARLKGAEGSATYAHMIGEPLPSTKDDEIPKIRPAFSQSIIDLVKFATSPSRYITGGLSTLDPTGATDKFDQEFCNKLLSPEGALVALGAEVITQAVIAFFTAGGGAAASEGALQTTAQITVKSIGQGIWYTARGMASKESLAVLGGVGLYALGLEYVVTMLSGTTITGAEQGAQNWSLVGLGTSIVQSRQLRTMYGAPLGNDEVAIVDKGYYDELKENRNKKGIYDKYFAVTNPFSLASRAVMASPSNFDSTFANIPRILGKSSNMFNFASLGSGLAKPAKAFAQAEDVDDESPAFDPYYGNTGATQQWGFTPREEDLMKNDPDYSIAKNPEFITDEQISQLDTEIGKCFDGGRTQTAVSRDSACTKEKLTTDLAFRYRLYKLDEYLTKTMEEKPEDILKQDQGTGTTQGGAENITAIVSGDTTNIPCKAGEDKGEADGYSDGKLIKIRTCKVQGIIINSQISGNLDNLLTAAKSSGLNLSGGGFRTMQGQIALRKANHCPDIFNASSKSCSPDTARPGYSNHQMGFAIDFDNCSSHGTACYKWLASNATTYGLKNYPPEPWHWSVDGH